ncbi:MAG: hypothetical protein C4308_10290 [Chitinophagaceae bacterium]
MKKITIGFAILLALFIGFNSCYYDVESQLYPDTSNCDTTNITYSTTIRTILQNGSCLSCHGGTGASGGGIILDTYTGVKTVAQNGKLYGAISYSPGYSPMPQNGGKLTNCDIKKVKIWIDSGIPNN